MKVVTVSFGGSIVRHLALLFRFFLTLELYLIVGQFPAQQPRFPQSILPSRRKSLIVGQLRRQNKSRSFENSLGN